MQRLAGRIAIVTGATKEMGETVAERLAMEGASVVCCGRDADRGEACAQRIVKAGGIAVFKRVDVGVEADVRNIVTSTVETFGRLDIVVNLAAAVDAIRGGGALPVIDETNDGFQRQLLINLWGPFWFFKYAIPEMQKSGGGSFVNLSSRAGTKATPGLPAYSASKAALEGLSRQVATDYAGYNIRSNCIAVGAIRTSQNAHLHDHPVAGAAMRATHMIPRAGSSADIAGMVAFLASDDSSFTTGELLPVDGGGGVKQVTADVSEVYKEIMAARASN
ncbi:NAD(P)-dependent dehydrogenase (short-subunit alcohol dehydrogenase family) [Novosphingobium taihuense]|nr:NAD(P)-dependent dehydrogenase (short-subunit alcohol dehydrogenase family) [Novosphingobium taihuense]